MKMQHRNTVQNGKKSLIAQIQEEESVLKQDM